MKICFIAGSFPYMKDGVGDYTSMVANNLADMGYEVSVITSKEANNRVSNFKVYNIISKFNYKSIKIIVKKLKEIKPDIILIQYPSPVFYNTKISRYLLPIAIKLKIKNAKLVETIHEYFKCKLIGRSILWLHYKIMDATFFAEEYYNNLVKKDFPNTYKKMNIINIPIISFIPESKLSELEKRALREKLNLKEKKIISYFGFARPNKGIDTLFEAFNLLEDENINLLYIGELKENNEYQKSLLELMKKLKIKNRVIITGYLKESTQVADYLSISDVCVLPYKDGLKSRYTSFFSACNQNVKIITTSLSDRPSEKGIYYIEPNNSKKLALKIKEVIYGKNIKSNKRIRTTWQDIAKLHIKAYKDLRRN